MTVLTENYFSRKVTILIFSVCIDSFVSYSWKAMTLEVQSGIYIFVCLINVELLYIIYCNGFIFGHIGKDKGNKIMWGNVKSTSTNNNLIQFENCNMKLEYTVSISHEKLVYLVCCSHDSENASHSC